MELRWRVFTHVSWIWLAWERIYMRLHPVVPVRAGALFGFRKVGSVVELHLDSRALRRMRETRSAFQVVRWMGEDLTALASRVRGGQLGAVSIITGTSLMGEAGGILGFETRPLPRNLASMLKHYFFVGLDAIYHPGGLRTRSIRRWPVETWMTADALQARYSAKSERSTLAR